MTRRAFTLIELLVAIAIIGILMALLMVALTSARDSGKRTQCRSELSQIQQAASLFKSQMGISPPLTGGGPNGTFRFCTSYSDPSQQNWPELGYLLQMFPNMDRNDNGLRDYFANQPVGWTTPIYLDGNRALFTWLTGGGYTDYTGFSTNPKRPFDKGGQRKGPWMEVQASRFLADDGYNDGHYRDCYGTPFACIGAPYTTTNLGVSPFIGATGKPYNPNTFQIISAGKDKKFGPGGSFVPGTGAYVVGQPGGDDMSNFHPSILSSPE